MASDPAGGTAATTPEEVIAFWCEALGPEAWFTRSDDTDRKVAARLGALHRQAAAGALDDWAETPTGALALVVLLDQVPRNLYRESAAAFASDARARAVARRALARGDDARFDDIRRVLLLLPFEHSEHLADQQWCLALFENRIGDPTWCDYARRHHDVIARFGRFPHRNRVLGRPDTAEEAAYLAEQPLGF